MDEVKVKGLHRIEVRDNKGNVTEAVLEIKYRRIRVLPPIGKQKEYSALADSSSTYDGSISNIIRICSDLRENFLGKDGKAIGEAIMRTLNARKVYEVNIDTNYSRRFFSSNSRSASFNLAASIMTAPPCCKVFFAVSV